MKTIQITIEEDLLDKVDKATQRQKIARSQFIRDALQSALRQLAIQELEKRHSKGYLRHPVQPGEFDGWDNEQAWG